MSFLEIILLSIGLAMDAFGVAVGKGLTLTDKEGYKKIFLPFLFGLFQFLMPIVGWFIGSQFATIIANFSHWIIFALLLYLGVSMIRQSDDECTCITEDEPKTLVFWEMIMLAVATSLDALAVGLTFAFLSVNVWEASIVIGITTFIISLVGIYLGKWLGCYIGKYAEMAGGIVLIIIGVKILLQHLGIIR